MAPTVAKSALYVHINVAHSHSRDPCLCLSVTLTTACHGELLCAAQEENAAMKKLGPKLEVSPATKRLWQELRQEMVSATRLFHNPSLCC